MFDNGLRVEEQLEISINTKYQSNGLCYVLRHRLLILSLNRRRVEGQVPDRVIPKSLKWYKLFSCLILRGSKYRCFMQSTLKNQLITSQKSRLLYPGSGPSVFAPHSLGQRPVQFLDYSIVDSLLRRRSSFVFFTQRIYNVPKRNVKCPDVEEYNQ